MEARAELIAPCAPEAVFAWVADLARYPMWMGLVHRVQCETPAEPDSPQAWAVELRGRVGPFARSKQLRMVRTHSAPPTSVRFERQEVDGRRHSAWVLEVDIRSIDPPPQSRLEMALRYEGRWWSPVLERVLMDHIESARARLLTLVTKEA